MTGDEPRRDTVDDAKNNDDELNEPKKERNTTKDTLFVRSGGVVVHLVQGGGKLKLTSRPDLIARQIFNFEWDAIAIAITLGRNRDVLEFKKPGLAPYTDQANVRTSDTSRKRVANRLVEKGFVAQSEANELMDAVSGFFAENADLVKLAQTGDKRTESDISTLIENDLDPRIVFDNLDRALTLLQDQNIKQKMRQTVRGFLVAPTETVDAILYHQAAVCAPPFRRYSSITDDYVLERGTVALMPWGLSGAGKGALLKLLRIMGVRILQVGRLTRATLERNARVLLHHTTLFFPEITALYAKGKGGEQFETDLARALKQVIEDNRLTLLTTEHDESGEKLITRVHDSGEIYAAPIMTTIEELRDVQMKTRADPVRLPDTVGGFLEIGEMIAKNAMLPTDELAGRVKYDGMTARDVHLVFQAIGCMNEGLLIAWYNQLDPKKRAEADAILKRHNLTLDYLKPIKNCTMTKEQRERLLRWWFETILIFVLPSEIHFDGEDEAITRKKLFEKLQKGEFADIRDIAHGLGKDAKMIEGISRDLWSAFRRAQASGLLHVFQRNFKTTEGGEGRVLQLDDADIQAGGQLLEHLATERIKVEKLSPREKVIIQFVIRHTSEENKLTALEIAQKFYAERDEKLTDGRRRFIRRALKEAADLNLIQRDTSEKTHRFWADYTTTTIQLGIEDLGRINGESHSCGKCNKGEGVHFIGKGIGWVCDECFEGAG